MLANHSNRETNGLQNMLYKKGTGILQLHM